MKAGVLRFLFILGFLSLFLSVFFFMTSSLRPSMPSPAVKRCPFFLGLKPPSHTEFLVSEREFLSFLSSLPPSLRKENWGLVLPLSLTQEEKWLVSYRSFLITPRGREEISHLSLADIQKFFEKPLLLEKILALFPRKTLFLRISSKDSKKVFENLKFLYGRENILLSSNNEELIRVLLQSSAPFRLIHSFREIVRIKWMGFLGLSKLLPGQGVEIPSSFLLSHSMVKRLKTQGKHLYLEEEAPLSLHPPYLIFALSGLLTSQVEEGTQFIKRKNPCLKMF